MAASAASAAAWGELMQGETTLVTTIRDSLGPDRAEEIFGADLVRRALKLASGARSSLMTIGRR